MTHTHSLFLFERKFDKFLFAPIGEEKNGMVLSVISALARGNVDPWQEAARLSRLPRDVATEELCTVIADLLPGMPSRASPRAIAERLIAPLPVYDDSAGSFAQSALGKVTLTRRETVNTAVVLFCLLAWMVFTAITEQSVRVSPVLAPISTAVGSLAPRPSAIGLPAIPPSPGAR
jgi:hypothetical protein